MNSHQRRIRDRAYTRQWVSRLSRTARVIRQEAGPSGPFLTVAALVLGARFIRRAFQDAA